MIVRTPKGELQYRPRGIRFRIDAMEHLLTEMCCAGHGYVPKLKRYRKGHERCRYCIMYKILSKLVHEHKKKYLQ